METDIVIIGSGPAGLFAVFQAGMLRMRCHVIDNLDIIGGQCSTLYPDKPILDIPAHPHITGQGLIDNLMKQIEPFKPTFHLGEKVTAIEESDKIIITTSKSKKIITKAVIIAAGLGAFQPKQLALDGITALENRYIHYSVTNPHIFKDKTILITGGGDSAADWAIMLSDIAKKTYMIHRRTKFRCSPEKQSRLIKLAESGNLSMVIPYQLHSIKSTDDNILKSVTLKKMYSDNAEFQELDCDHVLAFFGLDTRLGPILDWGLNMDNKTISVSQSTCKTNRKGIYAIGDIAYYENKVKLILAGFSEAASACKDIAENILKRRVKFEYSTNTGIPSLVEEQ